MTRQIRVAVAALSLVAAGCTGKSPAPQATATPAVSVAPTSTTLALKVMSKGRGAGGVVLTERRHGRIVYVLHADANVSDRFAAGTGRSVFTRPRIVFYQAQGKTLTAVAPTGTVEEQTKTVLLTGGVHAHTQDGITLSCDELQYDDRAQMLHGRGNVVVMTPRGERLDGNTLDADAMLNHVRVSGAGQ